MNIILGVIRILLPLIILRTTQIKILEIKAVKTVKEALNIFRISFQWSHQSKMFIIMVVLVTTVVRVYREIYIEHYNNKKFFNLLLAFFLSIVVLSRRNYIVNVIVGWEILGLTSLCLIMFYPNKTRKINSNMTILFNRIGDVLMIIVLRLITIEFIIRFNLNNLTSEICIIILICSLTKRAQIPISAWLPAAIAAPTPISAIVHSSTLVTAGIFLIVKIHFRMSQYQLLESIICLRIVRFFLGGWIRNIELDFKKIIAYSTIRQIRIIIFFRTASIIDCALIHIIYHAFFKTLLFCIAGIIFLRYWRAQRKNKTRAKKGNKIVKAILVIRIYCITGLIFSVSYYTKDLFLEIAAFSSKEYTLIIMLITARLITIFYRIKIIKPLKTLKKSKNFYIKFFKSKIIISIALITLTTEKLIKFKTFSNWNPYLRQKEIQFMILILIILPLWLSKNFKINKITISLRNEISHIKFVIYAYWEDFIKIRERKIILQSDLLFVKKIFAWKNIPKLNLRSLYILLFRVTILLTFTK